MPNHGIRKGQGKVEENYAKVMAKAWQREENYANDDERWHRKSRRKLYQGSGGASAFRKVKGDHSEKWRKIMTRR